MNQSNHPARGTSSEALWWALFSVGGVMAALFVPAIIFVTGFLLPTSDPDTATGHYVRIHGVVSWWPVRIVLVGVLVFSFFHCAHRVRHTLMDLGLRDQEAALKWLCYGAALAGSVATVVMIWRI